MHTYSLNVDHYQALIDRGWRRSGSYCYKPTMHKTCCPAYTIRCDALNIRLSKSQKKVLKRMNNFLAFGMSKQQEQAPGLAHDGDSGGAGGGNFSENLPEAAMRRLEQRNKEGSGDISLIMKGALNTLMGELSESGSAPPACQTMETSSDGPDSGDGPATSTAGGCAAAVVVEGSKKTKFVRPGSGADPSKPVCLKAKERRLAKQQAKLAHKVQQSGGEGTPSPSLSLPKTNSSCPKHKNTQPKSIEEFINEPMPVNPAHKLEVRLVMTEPSYPDLETSHAVYQCYQMTVHGDTPHKCRSAQYQRFLLSSPLELRLVRMQVSDLATLTRPHMLFKLYQKSVHRETDQDCDLNIFQDFLVETPLMEHHPSSGPSCGFGSFHQQYWLDGNKLIAVAVIDILPSCVSSVYFYYDPDYAFLSLGTYSSLRELALVRQLQRECSSLRYYYMGYYIHSCTKMQYKGRYHPSYLLCPETYTWHDIEGAIKKLDRNKFARLEDDLTREDEQLRGLTIENTLLLHRRRPMRYGQYRRDQGQDEDRETILREYCSLVGKTVAASVLLYLP